MKREILELIIGRNIFGFIRFYFRIMILYKYIFLCDVREKEKRRFYYIINIIFKNYLIIVNCDI